MNVSRLVVDSDIEVLSDGPAVDNDTVQVPVASKEFNKQGRAHRQGKYFIQNTTVPEPCPKRSSMVNESFDVVKVPVVKKEPSRRTTAETNASTVTILESVNDFPFKCAKCDLHFLFETALRSHEKKHASKGTPGVKNVCTSNTNTEQHLNIPDEFNKDPLKFKCGICGKGFKLAAELETHEDSHTLQALKTGVEARVAVKYENNGCFMCLECDDVFKTRKELEKHSLECSRYVCVYCEEKFTRKTALRSHELEHQGVKENNCLFCGKHHTSRSALRCHITSHFADAATACPECGRSFASVSSLKCHINNDHKGDQLMCDPVATRNSPRKLLPPPVVTKNNAARGQSQASKRKLIPISPDYHGYQVEGSISLMDAINNEQMDTAYEGQTDMGIDASSGVRPSKVYTPARLTPVTQGTAVQEATCNARMRKLRANWFYPPGWQSEPMKLPLNHSSSVSNGNHSTTDEQDVQRLVPTNQFSSVPRPAASRPLPRILSAPRIADSAPGPSGSRQTAVQRNNLFHAPKERAVLPLRKTSKIPLIRAKSPKNLLEVLEQCGADTMFNQPGQRTVLPLRKTSKIPLIRAKSPKNLLEVLEQCGADTMFNQPGQRTVLPVKQLSNRTPIPAWKPSNFLEILEQSTSADSLKTVQQSIQHTMLPVKQISNMSAVHPVEPKKLVDEIEQCAVDSPVARFRSWKCPQILPHERSVSLAPRAETKLNNVDQPAQTSSADLPLVAPREQTVTDIIDVLMPNSTELLTSVGEPPNTNNCPPVADQPKNGKRYYVRNPKRDIVYDVDSLYYIVRKYTKLEHSFLVVLWSENFDLDLATSIAFNATDCIVCVRHPLPSTEVFDIEHRDVVPGSKITIGPTAVLQHCFHCFTYGGISLSEAVSDDHQCDSIEIFEARLSKYAVSQGRTVLNLFAFSQYKQGWCKMIGQQLREKIVVARRM